MRIEVYDEKKEEEKVVRLKLFQDGSIVKLYVVDEDGDPHPKGCLLEISRSGFLSLVPYVGSDIGLELDQNGRIKIN